MKHTYPLLFLCLSFACPLFSQADTCPDRTWIKVLGFSGWQSGGTLCPVGDGNLYVTGYIKDSAVILKINPGGQILWARSFSKFFPGSDFDAISHLHLDSDGMLLGSLRTYFYWGQGSCYFKYDPQQDKLLWVRRPSPYTAYLGFVTGIMEKHPGGNYLIKFTSAVPPYEAVIMEINRQTGQKMAGTSWRYTWGGPSTSFAAVVLRDSLIYTTTDGSASNGPVKPGLICLSASDGQPKWWQTSPWPLTDTAFLAAKDLIVDDDAILSIFNGDKGYSSLQTFVFLQKTTLDGHILWVKKYDFLDFPMEQANKIIRVSDGYVMLGASLTFVGGFSLLILKTDLDGNVLWARRSASNVYAGIDLNTVYDNALVEMDSFLYFTGFSSPPTGSPDWLLAKVDSEGRVGDTCTYLIPTPVATSTLNPVQEHPPLSFKNEDIETILTLPIPKPSVTDVSSYRAICEYNCEHDNNDNEEEGCDIKINDCVRFDLLSIAKDAKGRRHYRIRFTHSCAGQSLSYIAIQLPNGTVAVKPADGAVITTQTGHDYLVRNPNYSPIYSIRFKSQGTGIGSGESDVFEYVLPAQAQPTYINVIARFGSGQSYEAHLNVFNCPEIAAAENRSDDGIVAQVSIAPNPVTDMLTVTLAEACEGRWQIFNLDGREVSAGRWSLSANFTVPVEDLNSGIYFIRIYNEGEMAISTRFVKIR